MDGNKVKPHAKHHRISVDFENSHAIFLKAQEYMNSLSLAENKPLELTGNSWEFLLLNDNSDIAAARIITSV